MEQRQAHMCYGGGCEHESHMMAEGGGVHEDQGAEYPGREGQSHAGAYVRAANKSKETNYLNGAGETYNKNSAKELHREKLSEMRSMPKPNLYAEGGEADEEMHPMIKKLMMGRTKGYSKGGMVANEGEDDLDKMADGMPNEFDDLALDDHLEGENSGATDGDELGDSQESDDRHDIVSRIMKSRSKKDRMPRPA